MITDDNYPDDQDGQGKDGAGPVENKPIQPEPDQQKNNSGDPFLDIIEGLALRQKNIISSETSGSSNDLTSLTVNNFPEIGSDERTVRKIEELNSIVRSIESRPSGTAEIRLERSYKIRYASELNNAQLSAVTTINGPVLVIAGAGSGKTRVKFLTEFALDPPSRNFGTRTVPLIDEGEDHPLTISTIHSAKGLEWYSVIIPHSLDGLIPSVRALNNIEEVEEERRLFYVACSRAKQELLITMPSFVVNYDAFLSYPSRFLVEIGRDKFFYQ